jgi:hypothetical protein
MSAIISHSWKTKYADARGLDWPAMELYRGVARVKYEDCFDYFGKLLIAFLTESSTRSLSRRYLPYPVSLLEESLDIIL